MAKKSVLQEAILEAKQVREAAIQQAYQTLEENLTPSIKSMLEQKLEEDMNLEEAPEELEETKNSGFTEVKPEKAIKEAEEDEQPEEEEAPAEDAPAEDGEEAASEDEEVPAEDSEEELPVDGEDAEEEAPADEEGEMSDDTKLDDLTVGDLKSLFSDLLATVGTTPGEVAPEGEMGADMTPGDVEGAGEEDVPIEGDEPAENLPTDNEPGMDGEDDKESEDDEEIDLAEILKELEEEWLDKDQRGKEHDKGPAEVCQDKEVIKEKKDADVCPDCKNNPCTCETEKLKESLKEKTKELEEALAAVTELKETLSETNLLNAKLMYTTRMLSKPLSESQKVRVMRTLDSATSPKEVKTLYNTLLEGITAENKTVLKEHFGFASKPVGGVSHKDTIVEVDPVVKRLQYLAGIRTND